MAKRSKIKTPDWILKGEESPKSKPKGKTFKVRFCPKCNSDKVSVVIGEIGLWECKSCKWKGANPKEQELSEDEFMEYLDKKEEEAK
jgi:ribosomal protein L37AE/L43A